MTKPDQDEQFYRETESLAFPELDDRQLAMLEPLGVRRILRPGELIYHAGQCDGHQQILETVRPRNFAGDVAALMGTASVASVRGGAEESEILEVPAKRLRQALAELPGVSEPIVRAFILRRHNRSPKFSCIRSSPPKWSEA